MWLAGIPGGATAKEAAFANGLALATAYHLLNTLAEHGLLAKGPHRRYVLGPAAATLARALVRGADMPDDLVPGLRALASRTRAAAYLIDWGEREMRMLASVEPERPAFAVDAVGAPLHDAHARATGKVLLAFADPQTRDAYLASHEPRRLTAATVCEREPLARELERVRQRGYAYDEQGFATGVACVAAPLLRGRRVVGAFGISVPAERFAQAREELTAGLLDVARATARDAFA